MTKLDIKKKYVIYGGQLQRSEELGTAISWQKVGTLINDIEKK